jgi:hypothetical protein
MRTLDQTQTAPEPQYELNFPVEAASAVAREAEGSPSEATAPPGEAGSFSIAGFPQSVLKALRGGLESVAIKLAVASGLWNEQQLTDLVFYARHPERRGRRLGQSEPDFARLSREWLQIRDILVRPSLKGTGPAKTAPVSSHPQPSWVGVVVPLLNRYRGDIPLSFLLGWISIESGGRIEDLTSLDERGYFQIHPDESRSLQLDHRRLSTDPEYSIQGGIRLIGRYGERVKQLGFAYGTDLFWHLVKLLHWLPKGVQVTCAHMREHGFKPTTWEEFKQYMIANRLELLRRIGGRPGTGWDPLRGIANVDKLFEQGKLLAP